MITADMLRQRYALAAIKVDGQDLSSRQSTIPLATWMARAVPVEQPNGAIVHYSPTIAKWCLDDWLVDLVGALKLVDGRPAVLTSTYRAGSGPHGLRQAIDLRTVGLSVADALNLIDQVATWPFLSQVLVEGPGGNAINRGIQKEAHPHLHVGFRRRAVR